MKLECREYEVRMQRWYLWMTLCYFNQTASIFEENKITSLMFLTLTTEELQELIPVIGEQEV